MPKVQFVVVPSILMKTKRSVCLCLALGCFAARTAFGDVLFSTFGPNDGFESSSASSITWSASPPPFGLAKAARFQISPGSYTLNSVSLAMGYILGTNNLAIRIVADNGGQPTGTLLETIVSHPPGITGQSQVVTYTSSLDPVLVGGIGYWLVVEPADLNLVDGSNNGAFNWYAGWNLPLGTTANHPFNFSIPDWDPWQVTANNLLPAFRIEGFAVPEPSSISLLLCGGLVAWLRSRRRFLKTDRSRRMTLNL